MNYVEVNGEQIPLKFGFSVIKKYMAHFKLKKWADWTQIPTLAEFGDLPGILHGAFALGAKSQGDDFTLTVEDVEGILDTHPHLMTQMWEVFIDDLTPAAQKEAVQKAMETAQNGAAVEVEGN